MGEQQTYIDKCVDMKNEFTACTFVTQQSMEDEEKVQAHTGWRDGRGLEDDASEWLRSKRTPAKRLLERRRRRPTSRCTPKQKAGGRTHEWPPNAARPAAASHWRCSPPTEKHAEGLTVCWRSASHREGPSRPIYTNEEDAQHVQRETEIEQSH